MKSKKKSYKRKIKGGAWFWGSPGEESWFTRTRKRLFSRNRPESRPERQPVLDAHYTPINPPTCRESQNCLLFGTQIKNLIAYFNFFKLDTPKESPVKLVWSLFPSTGANSVLYKVSFEREHYATHALLKTSKAQHYDNLMYEYLVGKYLNAFCSVLPSFVYTYGIYQNIFHRPTSTTPVPIDELNEETIAIGTRKNTALRAQLNLQFNTNEVLLKDDLCSHDNTNLSLLTQYLDGSRPLSYYWKWLKVRDMMPIMFQIYYALDCMSAEFEHNDLHQNNVLVYKLPKPMKFSYKTSSLYERNFGVAKVEFTSKYLVKIIDYGRCKFPDSDELKKAKCEWNGLHALYMVLNGDEIYKKYDYQLIFSYIRDYDTKNLHTVPVGYIFILEYIANKIASLNDSISLFGTVTIDGYEDADGKRKSMVFVPMSDF